MVDPTGHFFLSCLIVGTIVGAVIGGGVVGYQDYKDDGQIFNGSKTFGDYILGAAIGGAAGGAAGAVVGAVGAAGGVGAVAKTVGAGVKSAASWVGAKATAAWTAIATQGKKIVEGAKQVVSKIVDGVKSIADKVTGKTTLYRSVSNAEATDIQNTGRFNLQPGMMESKQFAFNLQETRSFDDRVGQEIIARAKIPTEILTNFPAPNVDTSIFRHGTLTIDIGNMDLLNHSIIGEITLIK